MQIEMPAEILQHQESPITIHRPETDNTKTGSYMTTSLFSYAACYQNRLPENNIVSIHVEKHLKHLATYGGPRGKTPYCDLNEKNVEKHFPNFLLHWQGQT